MKLAAIASSKGRATRNPLPRRKSVNVHLLTQRDWSLYEGLPNAEVIDVCASSSGTAKVSIRLTTGEVKTYEVGGLEYVVGRRGTLDFLSPSLQAEVLSPIPFDPTNPPQVSGRTLRAKAETSLEVAPNVFITGSLTGDSLIRHAVGGCVFLRDVSWVILRLPLRQALLSRPHAVVQIRHRARQAQHPMEKANHQRQVRYPTRSIRDSRRLASSPTGTRTCTWTGGSWPEASRLLRLRIASGSTRDGGLGALDRRNQRSSRFAVLMYRAIDS